MCGIVGYLSLDNDTRPISKEKFFREALYTDTLRGSDSTGIMSVSEKFKWSWSKQAVPGYKFIVQKDFFDREVKTWCHVGHNRAATVGEVDTDSAHPFAHDEKIILVHNGTLASYYDLPHRNNGCTVDSDLISYNLANEEPEDAAVLLGKLSGAYALVWFDTRDESVNFARNHARPFHMGINNAEDLLMFCSDGHMLSFVGSRLQDSQARPDKIWQMGTGQILKYKKGSLVPEVTKIVPFTRTVPVTNPTTGQSSTVTMDGRPLSDDKDFHIACTAGRLAAAGKATIAGTGRKIPQVHTTILEDWYHMKHSTPMFFAPRSYQAWGTSGYGAVYGKVFHPEWDTYFDAYIPHCTAHTLSMYRSSAWTVYPIAVDHTCPSNPKGGVTFVCRVGMYIWKGKHPLAIEEASTLSGNEIIEQEDEVALVSGPHGEITIASWIKLCEDGCSMCGGPMYLEDHEDVIWVGEMANQPLCTSCQEWATDAENDGVPLIGYEGD